MKNFIIITILLLSSFSYADEILYYRIPASSDINPEVNQQNVKRNLTIKEWEKITVQKGFILSNDLYYKRLCSKIWTTQIPEFKKKNPQVKDVNKFWPGDQITIQICEDMAKKEEEVVVSKKKKVKVKRLVEVEELVDVEVCPQVAEEKKEEPKVASFKDESDMMIMLGLGFLSETYADILYNNTSLRYGIKKELYPRVGYKLTMDFTSSVIFASNKIQLKTSPDVRQYYLSFGMGNRVGLQKRPDLKVSDNLNTYSLAGVGMLYNFKGVDFDVELGTTLNSNPGFNLSVTGVKKMSESWSLGAYFDFLSTDPKINDSNNQRNMITGGAIIFF